MHFVQQLFNPVSYTHLDVYKRQIIHHVAARCRAFGNQAYRPFKGFVRIGIHGKPDVLPHFDPVSYTHLDVYKRQG